MTWIKVHADYDDHHPYEAMELVAGSCRNVMELQRALSATERTLQFYSMAFDACWEN